MKKFLVVAIIVNAILLAFIAWMLVEAKGEYVKAESGLRIRSEPSTESEIVTVLPFGEQVFGEIEAGWMRLEDGRGYVSADWISAEDPCDKWQYLGRWDLTGYCWTGYPCANGEYPVAGYSLAHNTLPLGSKIWISGVGQRTVTDRGPSSLGGSWADIFMSSYSEAVAWGMQKRDVWLISQP